MKERKKVPQYLQVKRHILEQLRSGMLIPHDKLPTEREFTEHFNVNRNTVRHALAILEREGKIYRSGRKGWFASGRRLIFDPSKEHVNFDKRSRQQGFEPAWQIKENGTTPASGELKELFDVDEGTPLYHVFETGSLDGQPVHYSEYFFLAEVCPDFLPKIITQPMTDVLRDDYNIYLFQKSLLIRPINMEEKTAALLDLPAHYPGVFFRRVKTSQSGRIVEVDFEYWRADSIELRSNFKAPNQIQTNTPT